MKNTKKFRSMKRFKNYGLWLALFSLAAMVLKDLFGVNIVEEQYTLYVDTIMTILIALGIINNPSLGTGYRDR